MKKIIKIKDVLPVYNLAYMASTIDKRMIKKHAGTKQGFIYGINSATRLPILCGASELVSTDTIQKAKECALKAFIANPAPYYKSRLVLWTMTLAVLEGTMSMRKLRKKAADNRAHCLGLHAIAGLDVDEQLEELQKRGYSLRDIERAAKNIRQAEEIMKKAAA